MQKFDTKAAHTRYPWLVIGLCAAFIVYKYILQVSPSIMTEVLMREFQISGTGVGHLAAAFFYTLLITQLFVGYCLDQYNPRYLTSAALLLCSLGAFAFANAEQAGMAITARALMGIGAAFATVSYFKMTSIWFHPRQFAFVSGLLATAVMVGAIFGQAPLAGLIAHQGWRQALFLCGLLGCGLALLFVLFVRHQPLTQTSVHGRLLDTDTFSWQTVTQALSRPQNWLLTFYSGFAFAPVDAFAGLWGIPFLQAACQMDQAKAALLTSCLFIGFGVGSPLIGLLSDYLGKRRPLMQVSALLSLVMMSIVIYVPGLTPWMIGSLLFGFGLTTGAFMLGFAVGKELNPVAATATVIAFINTGDLTMSALTEPLIGTLLDQSWAGEFRDGIRYFSVQDYRSALAILPLYLLLALGLSSFIREPKPNMS